MLYPFPTEVQFPVHTVALLTQMSCLHVWFSAFNENTYVFAILQL